MLRNITKNWSFKSMFFGMAIAFFSLGINMQIPFSQSKIMIENGIYPFYLLGYLAALPFVIIVMINWVMSIKKRKFVKERNSEVKE